MGKIELDHTGSGSGITLSSDGTSLLLGGTAIGGGGSSYNLIVENYSNGTSPTVTGNDSIGIGDSATASGVDSYAIGLAATAAGAQSIALGGLANVSSGSSNGAAALGYFATVGAGQSGVALGTSYTSGNHALAAVIANNTSSYGATGANSIAMGYQAKSQGSTNGSVAIGHNAQATSRETVAIGSSAYATGSAAVALGGYFGTSVQARATGTTSFAVAGSNGLANKDSVAAGLSSIAMAGGYAQHNQSVAIGTFAHANVRGKVAWSSYPLTNADGATQAGNYVLSNSTTDATATKLVTDYDWTSAGSINQIVLPNNSVYGFTGTVIAREDSSSTDDFAVWEIKGGAVRAATASTTALGSYNINKISESAGAANWSIALSADTTNGAVAITVTGEASHNIRWVATVNTTEVIY